MSRLILITIVVFHLFMCVPNCLIDFCLRDFVRCLISYRVIIRMVFVRLDQLLSMFWLLDVFLSALTCQKRVNLWPAIFVNFCTAFDCISWEQIEAILYACQVLVELVEAIMSVNEKAKAGLRDTSGVENDITTFDLSFGVF